LFPAATSNKNQGEGGRERGREGGCEYKWIEQRAIGREGKGRLTKHENET
jgi:hypothetical protein